MYSLVRKTTHLVLLAMFFCFGAGTSAGAGGDDAPEALWSGPVAGCDGLIDLHGKDCLIEQHGGQAISEGVSGKALSLSSGDCLVLNAAKLINSAQGSLGFWVRPHWSLNDARSHTLASFTWADGNNAYFAISRGWWEPAGSPFTYFIFNNMDYAHVEKQVRFNPAGWTQLMCVWKVGKPGFVRLYVNGFKVDENTRISSVPHIPPEKLYFGNDQGSPMASGRSADCDISALGSYGLALNDDQVLKIYLAQNPAAAQPQQTGTDGAMIEKRAIFDEGVGWTDEKIAAKTIQRIKAAGFNIYVPCIWHGNGARVPTDLAPVEPGRTFAGDPLAKLIKIAHANGVQVHPWFTVALRQRDFLEDYYGPETPASAFDLHRPAFRDFITGLILDVARRYDIDGVNLDYIRTMGICQCDFCRIRYKRVTGRDLLSDIAQSGALEPHLQQWVDQDVQAIVAGVRNSLKSFKPQLCLSVDGHPGMSPNPEGREDRVWSNDGLVDIVFDMNYGNPPDFENYDLMQSGFTDPRKLIPLLADYVQSGSTLSPKDPAVLSETVAYTRQRWGYGVAIYLYSMLSDQQIDRLANGAFKVRAKPSRTIFPPSSKLKIKP